MYPVAIITFFLRNRILNFRISNLSRRKGTLIHHPVVNEIEREYPWKVPGTVLKGKKCILPHCFLVSAGGLWVWQLELSSHLEPWGRSQVLRIADQREGSWDPNDFMKLSYHPFTISSRLLWGGKNISILSKPIIFWVSSFAAKAKTNCYKKTVYGAFRRNSQF